MPRIRVFALSLLLTLAGCRRDPLPLGGTLAATSARLPDASAQPSGKSVRLRRRFAIDQIDLGIADLHMSRGLDEVLKAQHAVLVVNGGFFDVHGEPVGLVVTNGKPLSALKPSLSGGVLTVDRGTAELFASEEYTPHQVPFAIQCRPRLVVKSRSNIRSDTGERAARTAICIRDGGRELELVVATESPDAPGPTLFELANELAAEGCEQALNLDGGPSTGWASESDAGVVFVPPRAAVRHALFIRMKD